jgi:serine/tyrosine/threonine adenylyltransferase
MQLPFDNSYSQLPDRFFSRQFPTPVERPALVASNANLARLLGIDPDWLESEEGVSMLAGNEIPDGADPIATVYAGHQFGNWNPQLGDGRAVLLGEVIGVDGERYDLQLKGSGQTPYSRMGDGRAPLGPVLREYIVSEAMAALGIPTSRSLAAVTTGEQVVREQHLPGGVLARVARSHIRIGTLQYFASQGDSEGLRLLVDHIIARHYPDAAASSNPVLSLFSQVMAKQTDLVARWQMTGFIHGVLNTDNMLLSGETIDYGPCAFMDAFDPATVYSSIDQGGRYAYGNQPGIVHWNLACLAQALVPLLDENEEAAIELAKGALDEYPQMFLDAYVAGHGRKLGLSHTDDSDEVLIRDFLSLLETNQCDFTLAFRRLSELPADNVAVSVASLFEFPPAFDSWMSRWQERCGQEGKLGSVRSAQMLAVNPAVIPRNHLVEAAIAAAYGGDLGPFHALNDRLSRPFSNSSQDHIFAVPPQPSEIVRQTFCGT